MSKYEYSFKVENIEPYANYCIHNHYKKIKDTKEIRKLYKNKTDIVATITIDIEANATVLDFREDSGVTKLKKEVLESKPLKVLKNNQESIFSILSIFQYKLAKTFVRNRVIYEKENIRFEIDKYLEPALCYVVALEGEKEEVEEIYREIKNLE